MPTKMKLLPAPNLDRLREALSYDAATGVFHWTHASCRRAGTADSGYIKIKFDGKYYFAHRLAWYYVTGKWPAEYIDHINCNPSDNRIANLRECTSQQNWFNSRPRNASGLKGVYQRHGYPNRWVADIRLDGRTKRIGYFASKEEAAAAYAEVALRTRGEFARLA